MKSIGSKTLGELFLGISTILFLNIGYPQVAVSAPIASFTTSTATGLRPLSITFTDTSSGGATEWAWKFGDGTNSSHKSPNHTYKDAGSYTVTLEVKDATGATSAPTSKTITVTGAKFTTTNGSNPLEKMFRDISIGPPVPTIWTWDFGDGSPTDSSQNPTHIYAKKGTYLVTLTVNSLSGPPNTVTKPITIDESAPEIARGADQMWWQNCVNRALLVNGDFQSGENLFGWKRFPGQWSVGPSVNTQLIKYDFAKKKAGFNTSVGLGAAFRFYPKIIVKDIVPDRVLNEDGTIKISGTQAERNEEVNISQIHPSCRQTSFGDGQGIDPRTKKNWDYYAAPLFSITPTLYATKPVADDDLSLQPALLLGFFEDIINIGVGFNLTGPSGDKGNVFMLLGIGYGFKF